MKIPVTSKKTYTGRKEAWLEEQTDCFVLDADIVCVHKSHKKINAFQAGVTTCVYDQYDSEQQLASLDYDIAKTLNVVQDYTHIVRPDNDPEYVYTMRIPKGTYIKEYFNEYRFCMTPDVEINLIGTMGIMKIADAKLFPHETRCYGGATVNVFTQKF